MLCLVAKQSEVTSPHPFFISASLEKKDNAPRLGYMVAPLVEKVQRLCKEFLLGNV